MPLTEIFVSLNVTCMFIRHVLTGVVSALSFTSSPLYRYPYRSAEEAFRGDGKRIGGDITAALERFRHE